MNDRTDESAIGQFDQSPGPVSERLPADLRILYRERTRADEAQAARLAALTEKLQPLLADAEALASQLDALALQHGPSIEKWRAIPWAELEERGAPPDKLLWATMALKELEICLAHAGSLRGLRRHGEDLSPTLGLDKLGPERLCETIESRVKHARELPGAVERKVIALTGWVADLVVWTQSHGGRG